MSLLKNPKTVLILALSGSLLIGLGILFPKLKSLSSRPEPLVIASKDSSQESKIKVDVSGEVLNPNVYSLPRDSRISDAIQAAGGVTAKADRDWLAKNVNLAQNLTDGMKVYIPNVYRLEKGSTNVLGVINKEGLVNINEASLSELDTLPGIGPVTAQKIIDNRPYQSLDDLKNKKVVSQSVFEKIKDKITLY